MLLSCFLNPLLLFFSFFCNEMLVRSEKTEQHNALSEKSESRTIPQSETGAILVKGHGFRKNTGVFLIALYNGTTPFLSETELAPGFVAPISNLKSEKLLTNIKPGEYAISVMHDENGNKKMDYNMLGIPVEGLGLSNNVKIYFSKPDYKPCTFKVKAGETKVVDIAMKYFL
jgi:uncharacterized protein (DUF2141 family)